MSPLRRRAMPAPTPTSNGRSLIALSARSAHNGAQKRKADKVRCALCSIPISWCRPSSLPLATLRRSTTLGDRADLRSCPARSSSTSCAPLCKSRESPSSSTLQGRLPGQPDQKSRREYRPPAASEPLTRPWRQLLIGVGGGWQRGVPRHWRQKRTAGALLSQVHSHPHRARLRRAVHRTGSMNRGFPLLAILATLQFPAVSSSQEARSEPAP
jgi:hypothetical protein